MTLKLAQKKVNCLSFLSILVGIIFISGCAPQQQEQITNLDSVNISDESSHTESAPVDQTTKPAAVTIDNGSCIISNNGYIGIKGTMCQLGAEYAKGYDITVSGSMTGPEGTSFLVHTTPGIPDLNGEIFFCGGWEKDTLVNKCTRQSDSSIETAQWSLTRNYVMGEYVNVNPNMQVIINAEERDKFYEVLTTATYTISCPTVVYCTN